MKNSTSLSDGWTVILTATGPVDVLAYSYGTATGASLYDESGNEVLKTRPETVPGNFAAKGVLNAGSYTLRGSQTTLVFSGESFVKYETPQPGELFRIVWFWGWIVFCLCMMLMWFAYLRTGVLK
jgi:hypothetical protein